MRKKWTVDEVFKHLLKVVQQRIDEELALTLQTKHNDDTIQQGQLDKESAKKTEVY